MGELVPSEHLGFIVLGVWPTSWKSLVRACGLLWGARTGTGIRHATPLGVLGLEQWQRRLLVLGLPSGKTFHPAFCLYIRGI